MSDTITSTSGQFTTTIQDDGNLVLSDWGAPYWGSGTVRPIRPNPNPPPAPSVPPVAPLPMIRVDGTRFVDALTGAPWKYRGCSAFRLLDMFLAGQDIGPFCRWAKRNTIGVLRVLGMYHGGIGSFRPAHVAAYYERLGLFLDAVAVHGLSVEFVVFADVQLGAADGLNLHTHYRRVRDILRGRRGTLLEVCNEPFKNGMDPQQVYEAGPDLAQALGIYAVVDGTLPHADYVTVHTPRDGEWPRKAKDLLELSRLGWAGFTPVGVPCVGDEPMGIGPEQPGRRSMVAQDHGEHHACCALFGAGSTIHGDFGIACRVPDAEEQKCVDAIVQAWDAVPDECQLWTYTRGGLDDCPLENNGLRTYAMLDGNRAVAVRIRATAPPVARAGWRIIDQRGPGGCVVELAR